VAPRKLRREEIQVLTPTRLARAGGQQNSE
jgi:hypothetical protein